MGKGVKILLVALFITLFISNSTAVYAETGYEYDDLEVVEDIDKYLEGLNSGTIIPQNTRIETYETISLFGVVEDPSKSCSNIFGHSWGDWTHWEIVKTVPTGDGHSILIMERWHYCTRTYCGAKQREVDTVRY